MSANQQSHISDPAQGQPEQGSEAIASLQKVAYTDLPAGLAPSHIQEKDIERNEQTKQDAQAGPQSQTVLYLAYGSNLSAETFLGRRNIRPLSQQNVVVPALSLSFNLPGIPYIEPCFANTRFRNSSPSSHSPTPSSTLSSSSSPPPPPTSLPGPSLPGAPEKSPLLEPPTHSQRHRPEYHKDRWHKGLVGVVYKVTRTDYAKIIATEGAGSSYKDILIDCYPLPQGVDIVPETPDTVPFKAHTLFCGHLPQTLAAIATGAATGTAATTREPKMAAEKSETAVISTMPLERPDGSYAQPSARYLKLIMDGAEEHSFPLEYKEYLADIRAYTITSKRQTFGKFIFVGVWAPPLLFILLCNRLFSDRRGRAPAWLVKTTDALFGTLWTSYDFVFRRMFGDGERTDYPDERLKQSSSSFGRLSRCSTEEKKTISEMV
ncbi:hypothetical protein L228DRAFT_243325 [Xylona heveae TC161]|uniref:gamma-glutamylcyclotransferase n=1 Tax=Xylona heveae (strain CBS 132557 / TC161) TaxID=1328760 RepID=A0A165JYY5_XYLHT|nr:hypothetical protein L228DRAFT_243325 [Xylona heveae TC161]KZF26805.1 hypothetical protein L228DRAFT_243325 [Xylona heveae TC161]